MSSIRSAFAFFLALSTGVLSACSYDRLERLPPAVGGDAANGELRPKALQQNNGAQFVEYPTTCGVPLGQVAQGPSTGFMWFTVPTGCSKKTGGAVGMIDIATGAVYEVPLGSKASPLAIASSGGYAWIADRHLSGGNRYMYRFSADGKFVSFALPSAIEVTSLAAGSDGNVWFVGSYIVKGGRAAGIGLMLPYGKAILYPVTGTATPVLTSLASGADGNLWTTDQQNGAILRVTTGGIVTSFSVGGHPQFITNSAHALVFSDADAGQLSVISTSGEFKTYPAPSGSQPGFVARKDDGTVVYVDTANNSSAFGTFNPNAGTYSSEAQAPESGLSYLFNGPDGNMWFSDAHGHVGAYLKFILTTNPSSLTLSGGQCSATFTVTEPGYSKNFTVQSHDTQIANVSPSSGSSGQKFTVTAEAGGSTTILVQDDMFNVVALSVSVSNQCNTCPPLGTGTGLLQDGDFSEAANQDGFYETFSQGQSFAPNWIVTQATVDFYGSYAWEGYGINGLCSVDLDGSPGIGGIETQTLNTTEGTTYDVTFFFSGNSEGPPTEKVMQVAAAGQSALYYWNTATGGADQGDWSQEEFQFTASGSATTLSFTSQDANEGQRQDYGPVVAGISVTQSDVRVRGRKTLRRSPPPIHPPWPDPLHT